jgi:hypothetical protein
MADEVAGDGQAPAMLRVLRVRLVGLAIKLERFFRLLGDVALLEGFVSSRCGGVNGCLRTYAGCRRG